MKPETVAMVAAGVLTLAKLKEAREMLLEEQGEYRPVRFSIVVSNKKLRRLEEAGRLARSRLARKVVMRHRRARSTSGR